MVPGDRGLPGASCKLFRGLSLSATGPSWQQLALDHRRVAVASGSAKLLCVRSGHDHGSGGVARPGEPNATCQTASCVVKGVACSQCRPDACQCEQEEKASQGSRLQSACCTTSLLPCRKPWQSGVRFGCETCHPLPGADKSEEQLVSSLRLLLWPSRCLLCMGIGCAKSRLALQPCEACLAATHVTGCPVVTGVRGHARPQGPARQQRRAGQGLRPCQLVSSRSLLGQMTYVAAHPPGTVGCQPIGRSAAWPCSRSCTLCSPSGSGPARPASLSGGRLATRGSPGRGRGSVTCPTAFRCAVWYMKLCLSGPSQSTFRCAVWHMKLCLSGPSHSTGTLSELAQRIATLPGCRPVPGCGMCMSLAARY